jgi:hypothetical protein
MHKSTTWVAISIAALAIACDRPQGEGSAADQQETREDMERAEPAAPGTEQPTQPRAQGEAPEQEQDQARAQQGSAADNVRAAGELRVVEITADPDAHMDATVTVVGEVEDMLGSRAFKLNDESPSAAGQDDDLVVLGTQQGTWTMDDTKGDARMRVRGKLVRVPTANLQQQLGWAPTDKVKDEIEGEKVVLIAQSVQRLEGGDQQRAGERGDMGTGDERQGVRGEDQPQTR